MMSEWIWHRKPLLALYFIVWGLGGNSQAVEFVIENSVVDTAQNVCMPVLVNNFSNVLGFQYTIEWDTSAIRLDSVGSFELDYLTESSFGLDNAEEGFLTVVWNDESLAGITLTDSSALFNMYFAVLTTEQDSIPVLFFNSPTPPLVVQQVDTDIVESQPELKSGFIINLQPPAINSITVTDVSCFGEANGSITIEVEGGAPPYAFTWTGLSPSPNTNSISNLVEGEYTVTIIDDLGNSLTNTFTVVQPAPLVLEELVLPELSCAMPSGTVQATVSGGSVPYTFSIRTEANQSGIFPGLSGDSYELQVTDANGCEIQEGFEIFPPDFPTVEIIGDSVVCEGAATTLTAAGEADIYEWFFNGAPFDATGAEIVVSEPGQYTVRVTNADLCTAEETLNVLPLPSPNFRLTASSFEFCVGDTIQVTASGGHSYHWLEENVMLPEGDVAVVDFSTMNTGPAVFTVAMEDELSCFRDTFSLDLYAFKPMGYTGSDTCVTKGSTVQLYAFGGVEYFWETGEYLVSANNIANPTSEPEDSTEYVVHILDENQCRITDTVVVAVLEDLASFIKLINVITPNGDGENDLLEFQNLRKASLNKLVVFNRWGNVVYQKLNYDNSWNGTYKGKPLPSGAYYYILNVNGQQLKSSLTILQD